MNHWSLKGPRRSSLVLSSRQHYTCGNLDKRFFFPRPDDIIKSKLLGGKRVCAMSMNSCLCLNSRINRGQLQVYLIIFLSLSGLKCWQRSLPSCPYMSSFCLGHFLFPGKSSSQNKYCASWRAAGLSCRRAFPATVGLLDLSVNSGEAGGGSTVLLC